MPSVIDEHTQFVDSSGIPIVSGKIYIGTQNLNPVSNPITVYSDRALTTSLSQPILTDANGRATSKIWVPGRYSIRVDNSADVQQYQELDNGSDEAGGISQLTSVQGTNTITASGSDSAITSLVDGQQYSFKAANTITGAATLQIDLTAAKSINKYHDQALESGDIEQNQIVVVAYDSTDDVFEMVSPIANRLTGSWTPSVGGNATYASQYGYYRVIDDFCYFTGRMIITTIGSGNTNTISGLPFNHDDSSQFTTQVDIRVDTSAISTVGEKAYISDGGDSISIVSKTAAATSWTSGAILGNSSAVYVSGFYRI